MVWFKLFGKVHCIDRREPLMCVMTELQFSAVFYMQYFHQVKYVSNIGFGVKVSSRGRVLGAMHRGIFSAISPDLNADFPISEFLQGCNTFQYDIDGIAFGVCIARNSSAALPTEQLV